MSRRTDRTGRTALMGCSAAVALLVGLVVLGMSAYAGGILMVRTSSGYQAAVASLEAREAEHTVLGSPVDDGLWLGLQLARSDTGALELRVRSRVSGRLSRGTLYTTLQSTDDGWQPTSVLLDVQDDVVDVLARNADAAEARTETRRTTLLADARHLLSQSRFAEADVIANQAVDLDPDNPDAHAVRSAARLGLDDLLGAEADAREALNLDADNGAGQRALARVHHAQGDWADCIDVATIRIRAQPRDGAAWTIRSRCYLGDSRPREALAGAREACLMEHEPGCALARSLE